MRRIEESRDPDLANLPSAMRQAAQDARDEAARHGKPIVVMRNGKIVKVYPKLKKPKAA